MVNLDHFCTGNCFLSLIVNMMKNWQILWKNQQQRANQVLTQNTLAKHFQTYSILVLLFLTVWGRYFTSRSHMLSVSDFLSTGNTHCFSLMLLLARTRQLSRLPTCATVSEWMATGCVMVPQFSAEVVVAVCRQSVAGRGRGGVGWGGGLDN